MMLLYLYITFASLGYYLQWLFSDNISQYRVVHSSLVPSSNLVRTFRNICYSVTLWQFCNFISQNFVTLLLDTFFPVGGVTKTKEALDKFPKEIETQKNPKNFPISIIR